jgi:peptidoglycan/xylan/chitin deacetylase (PgdA/CDA1 family)
VRREWLALAPVAAAVYTGGAQLWAWSGGGGARWHGRGDRSAIALTFDDGPDPTSTPRVLDVLAREGVRATFFLIGRRAVRSPAIVGRIAREGHDLGNHTWSHRSLWTLGPAGTRREVVRGHAAITGVAGRAPEFFRAPWGMTNLALSGVLRELGTPCVFWSAQTEGLRPAPPQAQVARAVRAAAPGAILDLHDADGVPGAGSRLLAALPELIARLRDRGYSLGPLHEVL